MCYSTSCGGDTHRVPSNLLTEVSLSLLFFDPGTQFPGKKKLCCAKKINLPSGHYISFSSFTKLSWNRIALKCWIRTEIRWNKKLTSLSLPDWTESLRHRFFRNAQPDAFISSGDCTTIGWKIWFVTCHLCVFCRLASSGRLCCWTSLTGSCDNVQVRQRTNDGHVPGQWFSCLPSDEGKAVWLHLTG